MRAGRRLGSGAPSSIASAKRSATAAIVRLGLAPTGPGITGAVGDVQTRVVEHAPVWVDHALGVGPAHPAAAERMDGDHPAEQPERVVEEVAAELRRDLLRASRARASK